MKNQKCVLEDGFGVIDDASAAGALESAAFDVTFDNLCANGNITVLIISSNRAVVRSSVNDPQQMLLEFMDIIFGGKNEKVVTLVEREAYLIRTENGYALSEYLVLYEILLNGNLILMRSALESIRESVKLSSRFLLYIGILATAVSIFVAVFVSRNVPQILSES